jgi:uncharacterized repeat protein (TIGR03803 family)
MRQKVFWIAASCILVVLSLRPVFSSGAEPAGKEKVIYSFQGGADGAAPMSDLTLDGAGNLYGTTSNGGGAGYGTVFELKHSANGWSERVLYSFTGGTDGGSPLAGVIFDAKGNLYGTSLGGGGENAGVVFRLTPASHGGWHENTLYAFPFYGSGGRGPESDLVFDTQANLYGTTLGGAGGQCNSGDGCGAVFKLAPHPDGSWTETTVHVFTGPPDGGIPSGLVLDADGNLYGTTQVGGSGNCRPANYEEGPPGDCGTLFKLTRHDDGTWTETILYNFSRGGGSGVYPSGTPLFNKAGQLFGVTHAGGDGIGALVELHDTQNRGWQERVLHIFQGFPRDGIGPTGRLVMDANGDLFGVTSHGGSGGEFGDGIIFGVAYSSNTWKESILHKFTGSPDGTNPSAGLISDARGQLYGTTPGGGSGTGCSGGCGTVFEVTP